MSSGATHIEEAVAVRPELLKDFSSRVFIACGAPAEEAALVAEHLVSSSLMGYDSHGILRISEYVAAVADQKIRPGAPIEVIQQTETMAVADCGWNFGQVGGTRAVAVALEKARSAGISSVVTRRCAHVGRLGAYTQRAAEQGYLAPAFCNSGRNGHFVLPWAGQLPEPWMPGSEEVLLPGEPDFRKREMRKRDGVPIDGRTWGEILAAGQSLGVSWREEAMS